MVTYSHQLQKIVWFRQLSRSVITTTRKSVLPDYCAYSSLSKFALSLFKSNKSYFSNMSEMKAGDIKNNDLNDDLTPTNRSILMIPGPIEYEKSVLNMLSQPSLSHVSPQFISEFS